jgi:serine O-acetyltransferase
LTGGRLTFENASTLRALLSVFFGDLQRHHGLLREPGLWSMAVIRLGRYASERRPSWSRDRLMNAYNGAALALRLATRSSISDRMTAGEGLRLVHAFNLTIGPDVVLGERVEIMQDVTIDESHPGSGVPRIGNDVFIGAGATILGPVTIGDGASVGANSLVLTDVPAGAFAIGVPAKSLKWPKPAPAPNGHP